MTTVAAVAAAALAMGVVVLVGAILLTRLRADRRERRDAALRPELELMIAEYLAADDPTPPTPPDSRDARRLLRYIGLEAISQLQGGERDRLTRLLELTGAVDDTVVELSSRRRIVRREAAEALAEIRSVTAAEPLLEELEDPDPDVRLAAADALAELGAPWSVGPILEITDELSEARPGASAAILLTLGRRLPASLEDAMHERRSADLRRIAAAVIGALRLADHAPLLRRALEGDDDELVARAARGLGSIGDVDAVDRLIELLDDRGRTWFVRLAAAEALGEIGDPIAAPVLEGVLYDDNWQLRARVARSLRLLGPAGEPGLDRALAATAPGVRAQAIVALDR